MIVFQKYLFTIAKYRMYTFNLFPHIVDIYRLYDINVKYIIYMHRKNLQKKDLCSRILYNGEVKAQRARTMYLINVNVYCDIIIFFTQQICASAFNVIMRLSGSE